MIKIVMAGIGVLLLCGVETHAQTLDDEFSSNLTASFSAGVWQAQAASFKDYGYSPQLSCRVFTNGAMLTQTRRNESGQLDAGWTLLDAERRDVDNFAITWVKVDGVRYEATSLPWRLARPNDEGIILTFDLRLPVVRRDAGDEWLPMTYLTLPLLRAKRLEIGFQFEIDDHKKSGARWIRLDGFRQVTKWCGRELLRDRLDEERVRDLTK